MAYIFGAVCPHRDIGAALVLPYANAQAMNLHLEEISSQVTQGSHAVLLLDRAGWHQTGGKLRLPRNISLLHLPPYSPELNPAENIWQFLRQNHLSNRIFESYTDIVDACCAAWNAIVSEPKRIASIAIRLSPPRSPRIFFERCSGLLVFRMVTRACRELAEAHVPQFPAQSLL